MAIDEVFDFPSHVMFCIIDFIGDVTIDVSIAKVFIDASLRKNGPIPKRDPNIFICFNYYNVWVVN